MTNQMPNPQPPRDERQDELIASVIAFGAIGTVLFFGLGRLGTQPLFSAAQRFADSEEAADIAAGDAEDGLFGFLQAEEQPDLDSRVAEERLTAAERRRLAERGDRPDAAPYIFAPGAVEGTTLEGGDTEDAAVGLAPEADGETDAVDRIPRVAITDDEPVETSPEAAEADSEPEAAIPAVVDDTTAISGVDGLVDVGSDYWAAPFIDRLAAQGVVAGFADRTFRPDEPVTRAQFAAQLSQAFPVPSDADANYYSDITADYWASESIRQVSAAEFMSGYPEGDFRPAEQVSRLEVLVALVSGLSLEQPDAVQELLAVYSDQDQIPEWAAPKIATATDEALVINYPEPSSLNPNQAATRAETAAMIHQALVQQGRLEQVSSEYIVEATP